MATSTAVLDSCVLYPARLRDLLLTLAAADLFRPIWSDLIHEEWIVNVLARRPDLTRAQLERTRNLMNRAFPAATVQGFEAIIPTIMLPDPNDRHVVAASMHAGADSIVTFNVHHFPDPVLKPHGIVAVHSDAFVDTLFALEEEEAVLAVAKIRRRLRAPSMTPEEYIASIEALPMPLTVKRLRSNASRM